MLLSVMKSRSAKGRFRLLSLACSLSVAALTCGAMLATPAMAATPSSYAPPSTPVLSTSPGGSCSAAGRAVVGDGFVNLEASVTDSSAPSGWTLGVSVAAYASGHPRDTLASGELDDQSGQSVILQLSQAELDSAASKYSKDGEVSITWTARATLEGIDGPASPPSRLASCTFKFDDAAPSLPSLWADSGHSAACDSLSDVTIGKPATVYVTTPGSTTPASVPLSYTYSLNGGSPGTIAAGTTSPYAASFSVTPSSGYNVLTVTAAGPGGNESSAATCDFGAAQPGLEADQDLTGDNIPDLVTIGSPASGVAPGLWLAAGDGSDGTFNGTVNTSATDIAPNGPQGIGTPSSFDGDQALIGQFDGPDSNAVEVYDPSTGVAFLLAGESNGTVNASQEESVDGVFSFSPAIDANGDTNPNPDNALQLANAYNVSGNNGSAADEMGVYNDPALGGFLAYFVNGGPGGFDSAIGGNPYLLSNPTPDGTMDWSNWTITSAAAPAGAETPSGSPDLADMYLWNSQTGALYLWELTGLTNEVPGGFNINTFASTNATATLSYSQVTVDPGTPADAGWNAGSTLNTLQATQIDGGTGLIDVTSAGQVQSWTVDIDGSSATATIAQANSAGSSQLLQTGS